MLMQQSMRVVFSVLLSSNNTFQLNGKRLKEFCFQIIFNPKPHHIYFTDLCVVQRTCCYCFKPPVWPRQVFPKAAANAGYR